ncbi:MAG: hypothetical protein KAG64_04555 [Bacteroidales bacterium]|nr:hypothetical protein [Bacteroidales bacterium]
MNNKIKILLFIFIFSGHNLWSQDRFAVINIELSKLAKTVDGLNQTIDFSASGATIPDFVRALGLNNKINVSIDPSINGHVVYNFSGVVAKDILLFLCTEYDLDIKLIGSIISIHKYRAPIIEMKYIPKEIDVKYNRKEELLSINLHNDSLFLVAKALTNITGKNIILSPKAKNVIVSTYITEMPVEASISKLAYSNGLEYSLTKDGFYLLSISQNTKSNNKKGNQKSNETQSKLNVTVENNLISVESWNANISDVLIEVSEECGENYFLLTPIEEQITMAIHSVSFEEFLLFILTGTEYSYSRNNESFYIGKKDEKGLKLTKVIQLQHRSVVDFSNYIPSSLKSELEVIEFNEQNSLIVNGSYSLILKLEEFILSVDKVVPMVIIDILIIDNKSNYTIATGISAGLSDKPVNTSVSLLPGVDVTLGAQSINQLINSFNGYGLVNLGKVTPNFYLSIKALEANGVIKVKSTPKLSTLNGSEAELTLGNTTYYYEERNDVISNQSTQNITTKQYKSLQADFKVTILPIVSGDEQVTLEITVDQSDFTGEVVDGAPPGQVTRSFSSVVRVKNGEMILLGGLEEKTKSQEARGIPILSRIPVLKWLFSSRKKEKKSSKLNIFIKPTIVY